MAQQAVMKTVKITALAVVFLLPSILYAADDRRWFVTAQLGNAAYDRTLTGQEAWWGDVDDNGLTGALGVGYYFLPQLGVRVMYERTRDIDAVNRCPDGEVCPLVAFSRSTDTENFSLVALPRWQFDNGLALYGVLGAMDWRIRPRNGGASGSRIADDDDIHVVFGMGVEYRFASGFGVGAEIQDATVDYRSVRVGLTYHF